MKKKLFSEIPFIQGERVVLKQITQADAPALREMVNDPEVYRYLPTFLFEKKYEDVTEVIRRLYDECLEESIFLGIYLRDEFCGIAELYGLRDPVHKISIGCRLRKQFWGQGIGAEVVGLLVNYLYEETDIEIITASSMIENRGSAMILEKCGFSLVVHSSQEDWGFEEPAIVDKWIR